MVADERLVESEMDEIASTFPTIIDSFTTCQINRKTPSIIDSYHLKAICLTHVVSKKLCENSEFLEKFRDEISCSVEGITLELHELSLVFTLKVPEVSIDDFESFSIQTLPFILDNKIFLSPKFFDLKFFKSSDGNYLVRRSENQFNLLNRDYRNELCLKTLIEESSNLDKIKSACNLIELDDSCYCEYHKKGLFCISTIPVRVVNTHYDSRATSSTHNLVSGNFFNSKNYQHKIFCKSQAYKTVQLFGDEQVSFESFSISHSNSYFNNFNSMSILSQKEAKLEQDTDARITQVDKSLHSFLVSNNHWFSLGSILIIIILLVFYMICKFKKNKKTVSVTNYIPAQTISPSSPV